MQSDPYDSIGFWHFRRTGTDGASLRFEPMLWDPDAKQWLGQATVGTRSAMYYADSPAKSQHAALFALWVTMASSEGCVG